MKDDLDLDLDWSRLSRPPRLEPSLSDNISDVGEEFLFQTSEKDFQTPPHWTFKGATKNCPNCEKKTRSPKPCSESSSQLITFSG